MNFMKFLEKPKETISNIQIIEQAPQLTQIEAIENENKNGEIKQKELIMSELPPLIPIEEFEL